VDLRYAGQSASLRLPWTSIAQTQEAFHALHREHYGHDLDVPIELVTLNLSLSAPKPSIELPTCPTRAPCEPEYSTRAEGQDVSVYRRDKLAPEQQVDGPAIVLEDTATTRVSAGWCAKLDLCANIRLARSP